MRTQGVIVKIDSMDIMFITSIEPVCSRSMAVANLTDQKHLWDLDLRGQIWCEAGSEQYGSWQDFVSKCPWNRNRLYGMPLVAFYWQTPDDYWAALEIEPDDDEEDEAADYQDDRATRDDLLRLVFLTQSATYAANYLDIWVTKDDEPAVKEFILQHIFKGVQLKLD
jgi:hypothetical protein